MQAQKRWAEENEDFEKKATVAQVFDNLYVARFFQATVTTLLLRACEKEAAFLIEQGYPYLTVEDAVDLLCARLSQGGAFPHEIGLFLGYPIDDVVAFIANKGRNCLCCGCWKCYSNACAAQKAFDKFRKCTNVYKRLFACGRSINQLAVAS